MPKHFPTPPQEDAPQGFGALVRELRERKRHANGRRWSQSDLAKAVGVATNTVGEWERGRAPRDPTVLARLALVLETDARAFLASATPSEARAKLQGFEATTEATTEPTARANGQEEPITWPREARVFVQRFLLEATERGAEDSDLDFMRRALTMPEAYVMYHSGRKREMTPEEMRMEMEALATALRAWLDGKIAKRKEALRRAHR